MMVQRDSLMIPIYGFKHIDEFKKPFDINNSVQVAT